MNGEGTFFSPIKSRDDNYWIEFYSAKKTSLDKNVYITILVFAKCSIVIDESGNPKYELEKNSNGENIYFTMMYPQFPDLEFEMIAGAEFYNRVPNNNSTKRFSSNIQRFSKVRWYDETLFQMNFKCNC